MWKGDSLCIKTIKAVREKLSDARFRTCSGSSRSQDLASLLIWKQVDKIIAGQRDDSFLEKIKVEVGTEKRKGFEISSDKTLMFKGRLCVPKNEEIRKETMTEAHSASYAAHLGSTKMYKDLRNTFWWRNSFICVEVYCQQVKAKHQKPSGLLNPLDILE
ncbi:uncharacterized protein LOC111411127 [Olea europaea var. sylvestris]|uniref:uncharacterized protein LOC111411127 n=1 Tax=Olea europaea var. sylvestris TaxID=158386 RepID=UPI000C1D3C31|nr:uncharacterized protein LOC111411127 [Olea europaea var. sylvestris]